MVCQMDRGKPWELIQKPLVPLLRKKLLVAFVDGCYLQRESLKNMRKMFMKQSEAANRGVL